MEKVLVIAGPTAVGKTELSIKLAKKFNGEIISGDSMQVYRKLDIGTAKATAKEQAEVPHYLIDNRSYDEQYSVADFEADAQKLIKKISVHGNLPIIVGGTGFYLDSLLKGLSLGSSSNSQLRESLKKEDSKELWNQLNKVDSDAAQKIPVENKRRIIRAIEVFNETGKSILNQNNQGKQFNSLIIGLNTDRSILYDRINQRVDSMIANGLIEEAQDLYQHGGISLPASKGIGYKEFDGYFAGSKSLNQVKDEIKKNSRHYAKRQLTWFRNKMDVEWFDVVQHPDEINEIYQMVKEWKES